VSQSLTAIEIADRPLLQLHLEPESPLEVSQYAAFVEKDGTLGRGADAKLLVLSVSPGSIDIAFLPNLHEVAGLLVTAIEPLKFVTAFANSVKSILELFKQKTSGKESPATIRDCDDVINMASPIANHGGTQSITVIQGGIHNPILVISALDARSIVTEATNVKIQLQSTQLEVKQRVPLVWTRLDRNKAKSDGNSPDKAKIEEIDPSPKAVFFVDELAFLKDQMIRDEENPYQKIYFVDVEVSRAQGRVASYRVIAYHGKDDLD